MYSLRRGFPQVTPSQASGAGLGSESERWRVRSREDQAERLSPVSCHLQMQSQTQTRLWLEAASYRTKRESSREQETGRQYVPPWSHLISSLTHFSVWGHLNFPSNLFLCLILILPSLPLFPFLFPLYHASSPSLLLHHHTQSVVSDSSQVSGLL